MNAETRIYIEVNGQLHAKSTVILGKRFLIPTE